MAAKQIYEHNIPELDYCHGKFTTDSSRSSLTPLMSTHHPDLGAFHISDLAFPNMHLLDMAWNIPHNLIIHESNPSETIDVNFVLDGNIQGNFHGLKAEFGMHRGTNNLKFTPSEKSKHSAMKQDANMFVIALDKKYFCDLIGHNSQWSESTQRKIENNENFIASEKFLTTSPHMHALVQGIRNMQSGPVSRLLTQSMIFELLALQIDQFTELNRERAPHVEITVDDMEKLHRVKQFIDQHFLEDLTLTSLSREGMLNEFKLKKGFKLLFGTSVIQYARQLRMQYARTLLRDHRMSIEEVSAQLGYQYPNHFTVAYKKHFGILPSDR